MKKTKSQSKKMEKIKSIEKYGLPDNFAPKPQKSTMMANGDLMYVNNRAIWVISRRGRVKEVFPKMFETEKHLRYMIS